MTYKSFEELPVWQKAAELYDQTDEFLDHTPGSAVRRSHRQGRVKRVRQFRI